MGDMAQTMVDFGIPIAPIEAIDNGRNPDSCMKDYYSWSDSRNSHTRGRIKDAWCYEQSLNYGVKLLDETRKAIFNDEKK